MDAAEVTRLLDEAHPEGMTWETHLSFVDRMTTWDEDAILDFHETIVDHLVAGRWSLAWRGESVHLPSGEVVHADNVLNHLEVLRSTLAALRRSLEAVPSMANYLAGQESDLEALELVGEPVIAKQALATDHIGIPTRDSFSESWAKQTIARGGKPSRRRVLQVLNDESLANAHDLVLVLRSGAWAFRRKTGAFPKGVLPSSTEERHVSSGLRLFRVVHLLQRDDDEIETVFRWMAPTHEYLAARLASIAPVARALSARVAGSPRLTDLGALEGTAVPFGTILDEWRTVPDGRNRLLDEARDLLSGNSRRRAAPPLDAKRFWELIDILERDASNASALMSAVSALPPDDIVGFAEALADALFALDRPEFTDDPDDADQIPMSEDVFLHFRCSVVAGGRAAFERVLDEGVLRERDWEDDGAGEQLLSVAPVAFERATGREWDHATHVSYETGSNREAWGTRRSLQDRGWEGWVCVRSRSSGPGGEVDTVRKWRTSDAAEARGSQLEVERARPDRRDVRIVDDLRISSRLSPTLLSAPVDWVRSPIRGTD